MKVLNGVEHYNSFGELREVFGLKPVQRTNKEKLNSERESFGKKFICKVCGAPLVFERGTNIMVCQNPKCKGVKKTNYDVNDYMKTVDSYMDDPERFAKVLRNTGEILDERMEGLRKTIQEMAKIARIPKIKVEYKPEEFSEYLFGKPYVHYYDSLGIEVDSLKGTYRLVDHETSDTTYDGIRMIIRDTLEVTDSLASIDSIVKPDTLSKLQKQALKIENKVIDKAKNLTKFKIAE